MLSASVLSAAATGEAEGQEREGLVQRRAGVRHAESRVRELRYDLPDSGSRVRLRSPARKDNIVGYGRTNPNVVRHKTGNKKKRRN